MVDFKSILGTLLESGLAPSASQRIGSAVNAQRSGGLGSMFGGLGVDARRRQGGGSSESAPCWVACSATRKVL